MKKNNHSGKSNSKKTKKKVDFRVIMSKKLSYVLVVFAILLIFLIIRLAYFQFIKGRELKEAASIQQATSRIISPNRGIIYDSTGKVLAQSAAVDTISINPSKIKKANKEKVAKALSDIFELEYDIVLEQVNSERSVETIIKKVEKDKVDALEEWMKNNDIKVGINIDSDFKRYYPYKNLASNLLGFCNTDNNGQEGIELKWNSVLSGTPGKLTTIENAARGLIPDKNQSYVAAENGSNITLTIDATIQGITEKYLKQACIENNCKNGGSAIIMDPKTGDILAMASYPDFDSNNPRSIPETLVDTWEELSDTDKMNSLYKIWRNKCVSDTYEPGSTYKIITAAVGLEEDIVETDTKNDFVCVGHEIVNGLRINCWKYETTHGYQTLRQSLMNSCNPALIQLGKRIGATTLYKYYKALGLFSKTNIATSGESNSFFWDLQNVGNIELATMSFGQRFKVTPIQLISAISSVANHGVLMQPRIVKEIQNADTGSITSIDPVEVRKVFSTETCEKMLDMLEAVVSDGTGYLGAVQGYSIAGKTGTSEPDKTNPDPMYVASFVGIAPSDNPELVILVTLYGPPAGSNHQGGSIAAPVVSQILKEVLPYLGIPADSNVVTTSSSVTIPDVRNKTIAEAKKILSNLGINANISSNDETLLVADQVPKPGTLLSESGIVCLYSSGNEARTSVTVPNLKDMSLSKARNALKSKNLNISVSGSGTVVTQDPMAGTTVEEGTIINITLKNQSSDVH